MNEIGCKSVQSAMHDVDLSKTKNLYFWYFHDPFEYQLKRKEKLILFFRYLYGR